MTVAVFGHHPDLFPGFNSLMTVNLAYGLRNAGLEVHVLLPNTESHPQHERLEKLNLTPDGLDRFGSDFEIRVIDQGEKLDTYDLAIWQSYFAQDEPFFPAVRAASRIVAKNFPRLLIGERQRDIRSLAGSASRFDVVGLALRTDYDIASRLQDEIPDAVARAIYMPRGFRADWFSEPELAGPPVLGLEKGVQTDSTEYDFLLPVFERLRGKYGQLEVIGARINDPGVVTKTVGLRSAKDFYREFLNPLWAYLMIDVTKSRQSMNAVTVDGKTVFPGMYENQVVEAQLAGAAVVGQQYALPQELIGSDTTGLRFTDYSDADEIFEFLCGVIDNRSSVATTARQWAIENHSVSNMINPLLAAIA